MAVVLVIEDDPVLAQLLQEVLSEEGYRTVTAASLSVAAALIRREPVDLVLADLVEFDRRGGAGAIQALEQLADGRPILLCTGQPGAARLGDRAGVAGVLAKPFDFDTLLERLREALVGVRADRPRAE